MAGMFPALLVTVVDFLDVEPFTMVSVFCLAFFIMAMVSRCSCFFSSSIVLGAENQLSNRIYFAVMPAHCAESVPP